MFCIKKFSLNKMQGAGKFLCLFLATMSSSSIAYYIKADPKFNIAGFKFKDILCCFVKFGWPEGLPDMIW